MVIVYYVVEQMQLIINLTGFLHKDTTSLIYTAPDRDHSVLSYLNKFMFKIISILPMNDGYYTYIYVETSLPVQSEWKTRLESEIYYDNCSRYFLF
ncbi:unnamed protein product [Rotaria sp. Silwood2]|nr:unnamed protein product [Rotaria sp. Silwood2]CAF4544368.1 unnamed protein product [Rotaria sp. Silwood2]